MVGEGAIPLVALGMNGEPLTMRNGFPARLLTPGIWGADASTKWLATIELTTWANASDYWDARGWPRVVRRHLNVSSDASWNCQCCRRRSGMPR